MSNFALSLPFHPDNMVEGKTVSRPAVRDFLSLAKGSNAFGRCANPDCKAAAAKDGVLCPLPSVFDADTQRSNINLLLQDFCCRVCNEPFELENLYMYQCNFKFFFRIRKERKICPPHSELPDESEGSSGGPGRYKKMEIGDIRQYVYFQIQIWDLAP